MQRLWYQGREAASFFDQSRNVSINNLADNCLENIFRDLSFADKLNAEAVCKRWKFLCRKSWKTVTSLNLLKHEQHRTDYDSLSSEQKNIQSIAKLLKRCGDYLKVLKIGNPCHYTMLPFVFKYCRVLRELTISLPPVGNDLSGISEIPTLRKFCLTEMSSDSQAAIFKILPPELLELHLMTRDSQNKNEVEEYVNFPRDSDQYLNYLENLHNLLLSGFHLEGWVENMINRNVNIRTLALSLCSIESEKFFFYGLVNLESLLLDSVYPVDNNFIAILSECCEQLTTVNLIFCPYVTDIGVMFLWRLSHLRYLCLHYMLNISDVCLSGFASLKMLICHNCLNIRDSGLIALLEVSPELKTLVVTGTSVTSAVLMAANEVSKKFVDNIPIAILVDVEVASTWIRYNDSVLLTVESLAGNDRSKPHRPSRYCDNPPMYDSSYVFQYQCGSDSEPEDDTNDEIIIPPRRCFTWQLF
ncbi:uncharacterized protein LOC135162376 [Diachasmimorpha longicaudata]|uniref:uncharacterized protein LOC135162376 n=1 Tax=Diachasmimorpha longicaudata TaxID=58733 RepID=UPI0030B91723